MLLVLLVILVLLFIVLPLIGMAAWALLTTLAVGLFIGGLARLIIPGRQAMSVLATIGCGLIGSILGGFFGQHVFHAGGFVTVLLEVVVAVIAVGVVSRAGGERLSSSR